MMGRINLKPRVLIVGNYHTMQHVVKQLGQFNCMTCNSALAALEYLRANTVSAVLVEEHFLICPPGMDFVVPDEIKCAALYDRGEAFVSFIRNKSLIKPEVPAFVGNYTDLPLDCMESGAQHATLNGDLATLLTDLIRRSQMNRTSQVPGLRR